MKPEKGVRKAPVSSYMVFVYDEMAGFRSGVSGLGLGCGPCLQELFAYEPAPHPKAIGEM